MLICSISSRSLQVCEIEEVFQEHEYLDMAKLAGRQGARRSAPSRSHSCLPPSLPTARFDGRMRIPQWHRLLSAYILLGSIRGSVRLVCLSSPCYERFVLGAHVSGCPQTIPGLLETLPLSVRYNLASTVLTWSSMVYAPGQQPPLSTSAL